MARHIQTAGLQRTPARLLVALLAVTLALAALPGELLAAQKRSKGSKPIVSGKAGKRIDEAILKLDKEKGGFWGSALVSRGTKVLLYKGYGLMDPSSDAPMPADALWDWASVSKQFTAAAILRLEMENKLSIDDSIRKFFPQAPADKQVVKLRHLMNHTSGIRNTWGDEERASPGRRDDYVLAYLKVPMLSKPGERWAYNNEAYSVLAAVVEMASNMKYEEFCLKKLFKPAAMKDTSFIGYRKLDLKRVPRDDRGQGRRWAYFEDRGPRGWNYRGMGGVVASTLDMFKWHHALRGKKVLSEAAKKRYYEVGLQDYALGWRVKKQRGDTFYSHGGSVGKHVTFYMRAENANVVVALVYGYPKPAESPEQTALRLFQLAMQK